MKQKILFVQFFMEKSREREEEKGRKGNQGEEKERNRAKKGRLEGLKAKKSASPPSLGFLLAPSIHNLGVNCQIQWFIVAPQ